MERRYECSECNLRVSDSSCYSQQLGTSVQDVIDYMTKHVNVTVHNALAGVPPPTPTHNHPKLRRLLNENIERSRRRFWHQAGMGFYPGSVEEYLHQRDHMIMREVIHRTPQRIPLDYLRLLSRTGTQLDFNYNQSQLHAARVV